jgi:Spy/CpxP family protein refolding chaperone
MKTKWTGSLCIVALSGVMWAQNPPAEPGAPPPPPKGAHRMMVRHEMGKWWQNPEIASKLQLTDAQVTQLNQVFYNHKLKLIDYGAEMEKQDLKLQTLLDADQPDEAQVSSQVDQVLAARGKLEREFTMMNLNLRKQLSLEQWRQLKAVRGEETGPGDHFFFQKRIGPGGPGGGPDMPSPPPPGEMQ